MTPIEYYLDQCSKELISKDSHQLVVLQALQKLYEELISENQSRQTTFSFLRRNKLIKGVYLWGSVGIGKTFMMDCFYHCIPFNKKMRMHFHQFMQWIHQELKLHQGKKNPLEHVADDLAQKTMVLCFDELFVSDITDAMLLGKLFDALFSRKICLVATSNSAPDDLYKNGLQREQFLPAIDLLKLNMNVVFLPTSIDYRLRHLKEAGVFYTPLNKESAVNMENSFQVLAGADEVFSGPVEIHHRLIHSQKRTNNVIWFEFIDICTPPRSQQDFLAIAEKYQTVFISNIPPTRTADKDTICLFINLVDVFYDARVRIVVSSAEPVSELYRKGTMVLEFARTHSRLLEMQSEDYFSNNSA